MLHAKAVLLVDDGQPEVAKLHVILKQRVGADNHGGLAGGDQLQLVGARLALELARHPGHRQPQGTEPALEVVEVLLGQNLGWRHERYLPTRFDGLQRCERGDHCLAGANITLHQPQHWPRLGQIEQNLVSHPALGAGQRKPELGDKAVRQFAGGAHRRGLVGAHLGAQAQHGQLVRHQLFKGQAVLCPVAAVLQGFQVDIRRRPMQQLYCFTQRRQPIFLGQGRGQPLGQVVALGQPGQGAVGQAAQALLGQPLGGRVDGREGVADGQRLGVIQVVQLRVIDLKAGRTGPHLTVTAPVATTAQARLERGGKVVKAQAQRAAAVLQAAQQAATPAHDHLGGQHRAFHHGVQTRLQGADGGDAGTVLITQRQVKQQVLDRAQAQPVELVGQRRSDALENGQRGVFGHWGG